MGLRLLRSHLAEPHHLLSAPLRPAERRHKHRGWSRLDKTFWEEWEASSRHKVLATPSDSLRMFLGRRGTQELEDPPTWGLSTDPQPTLTPCCAQLFLIAAAHSELCHQSVLRILPVTTASVPHVTEGQFCSGLPAFADPVSSPAECAHSEKSPALIFLCPWSHLAQRPVQSQLSCSPTRWPSWC